MNCNKVVALCAVLSLQMLGLLARADAAIFDSINGSAAPARPELPVLHESFANIGWYYTPATSYTLTGISTVFGPAPGATGANTITVQIQSERPAIGGAVLAEATFEADQAPGGLHGGSFAPLPLTAGQQYFVNFLDIRGMGVNVGTWDFSASFVPQLSLGATVNLGAFYRDDEGLFATETNNPWGIAGDGVTRISGSAPILMFDGFAVPEPSSVALLAAGTGLLVLVRRRKEIATRL